MTILTTVGPFHCAPNLTFLPCFFSFSAWFRLISNWLFNIFIVITARNLTTNATVITFSHMELFPVYLAPYVIAGWQSRKGPAHYQWRVVHSLVADTYVARLLAEALRTTMYLLNRHPTKPLQLKTPHETLHPLMTICVFSDACVIQMLLPLLPTN